MSLAILAYITAPSREEACRIGRLLVENRLAGCVNVIPSVDSFYWWKGRLANDQEAVIIAKTLPSLKGPLADLVRNVHPYEVPAILFFEVEVGNEAYLKWLESEVMAEGPKKEGLGE